MNHEKKSCENKFILSKKKKSQINKQYVQTIICKENKMNILRDKIRSIMVKNISI